MSENIKQEEENKNNVPNASHSCIFIFQCEFYS